MKVLIIILVCVVIALFFIIKARNLKNQSESKLSIFEHPSTFEKPPIEMVSTIPKKEESSGLLIIHEIENEKNGG